jgi:hypothetical protein
MYSHFFLDSNPRVEMSRCVAALVGAPKSQDSQHAQQICQIEDEELRTNTFIT